MATDENYESDIFWFKDELVDELNKFLDTEYVVFGGYRRKSFDEWLKDFMEFIRKEDEIILEETKNAVL